MTAVPLAVEMRGIVKRFPGVLANDQADFDLRRGEIHALLGENGAGKTTLMSMLAGLYKPDAGMIRLGDETVSFRSPRDAIARGLGMIHQHFTLIGPQTVTENILLGMDEPRFLLKLRDYDLSMTELGERFGLQITPTAKIWQLSVGEQQRVEILKMLYRGVKVLIMDEPTAVLAPQEVEELFKTLRAMAGEGKSIVFISHKLQEVMAIADRITVLRQGRVTAPGILPAATTKEDLARLMVGRPVLFEVDRKPVHPGEVVLEGPGGGNRWGGGGGWEWATRNGGCDHGAAPVHGGPYPGSRRGGHQPAGAEDDSDRRLAHPRGPYARRNGAQPEPHRQLDHEDVSRTSLGEGLHAGPQGRPPEIGIAEGGVRHSSAEHRGPDASIVGWKLAAGDPGARALLEAAPPHCDAADTRPGCGGD